MDTTLKTQLPNPAQIDLVQIHGLPASNYNLQHGNTTVVRSAEQAAREERFMQRSRDRRMLKTLREQLDKARRRRFAKTQVPVDVLEQLLTRVENADG